MYIGEASKKTNLSIKAIRFYEKKKLIKEPRRVGKYRFYDDSDIELLILIKEATQLGITLAKLEGVIAYKNGKVDWIKIKTFLNEVKADLLHQIDSLKLKVIKIDQCCSQMKP
ncbi:MAG: MerR family transcriptional regulator [Xanthomonadales bacterium]|nr:MerR family transcriptional regulator [Xanthomonadales bacterium]